jgi:hypothetical protein
MSNDIKATIDERPITATIQGAVVNITGGGGGGVTDGDKGDIVVSGAGETWTIQNMDENATVTTGTYVSKVNQDLLIKVRKATSGTITKGQAVYIVGSTGNHLTVELARADVEATSAYTIGIAATTITSSNDGFVIQNGRLTGLSTVPTATFSDGDTIYLSETTAGGYRVGIPTAPNHGVLLGFVIKTSNGNAGEIDIRVQNYQELEELSDVYINNKTTNDFLVRKATRWENITPADVKTILAINNVDNTSDLNKPISSATQAALDGKQPIATVLTNTTASFTTAQETKLAGIATGAEVNVNADWNAVSGDAQILNKPTISGTNTGDQTSIVGITGTLAQFNTAVTDANLARTDAANTFTGVQTFSTPIAATSVATMTSTVGGGVPTPPNNTTTFLRGDGTFAAPSSGFADPLTTNGDIIARVAGATTRLAQGANGSFLGVSGGALGYYTPAGSGDVSKVGTPVNNQVGVWTGDGTIEGDANLTFDTATDTLTVGGEVVSPKARASSSAGLIIEANNGTDVADFGVGNTANSTFYGAVQVPDGAYDATTWNGNTTVPTKNAIRDKIESMGGGGFTYPQLLSAISLRI